MSLEHARAPETVAPAKNADTAPRMSLDQEAQDIQMHSVKAFHSHDDDTRGHTYSAELGGYVAERDAALGEIDQRTDAGMMGAFQKLFRG